MKRSTAKIRTQIGGAKRFQEEVGGSVEDSGCRDADIEDEGESASS